MSAATEIERLLVRLVGDNKEYLKTLDVAARQTSQFVRDADGRFRDLKGRFVSVQEVIRSEVGLTKVKLQALGSEIEKSGQALQRWGQRGLAAGKALSVTITAPLVAVSGLATKAAIDFESSFAGIRKTVDATEEEFMMLENTMRGIALKTPIDVNELNAIGEAAGQLGIEVENIAGFTQVMADLGVATNLTSDQAATALARMANITKLPQDQFDRLGSAIVGLGNNFATTEAEIVEFGLRIAGAGEIAGLSEAEILGIGAAMSSIGVEAEAGGTSVQKVLLGMSTAVASGNEDLSKFAAAAGMSAEGFAEAFRKDAAGAFASFVEGLGKQGIDAVKTLEDLGLEDQRLIRSFLSLGSASDVLRDALEEGNRAFAENTALTEEASKRYATTASQIRLLWNSVKDIAITLGQALLPIVDMVIAELKSWVPVLQSIVDWFKGLSVTTRGWIVAVLALLAALGPVLATLSAMIIAAGGTYAAFGALISSTRALTVAFWSLKAAMTATGIGIAVGLISYIIDAGAAIAGVRNEVKLFTVELDKMDRALIDLQGEAASSGSFLESLSEDELKSRMEMIRGEIEKTKQKMNDIAKADGEKINDANSRWAQEAANLQFLQQELKQYEGQLADMQVASGGPVAYQQSEDAKKQIDDFMRDYKRQIATFGKEGVEADLAGLMFDLEQDGEKLTKEQRSQLGHLASQLKVMEDLKKAEEEREKIYERMAKQAVSMLNDSLTPVQKLKQEVQEIDKLVAAGALTSAEGQRIKDQKAAEFAKAQFGEAKTIRSAGKMIGSQSSEALIALRGGSKTDQKSTEKGVWKLVDQATLSLRTEEEILKTLKERDPMKEEFTRVGFQG